MGLPFGSVLKTSGLSVVSFLLIGVVVAPPSDHYWYSDPEHPKFYDIAAISRYWCWSMGYSAVLYEDEEDDFLEDRAETVAIWWYSGHGFLDNGHSRLQCNGGIWAWWKWVRACDIEGRDCDQILLVFACACHSLSSYDLADAFVDSAGADAYIGHVGLVWEDGAYYVSHHFGMKCDAGKTISQALTEAQAEWNSDPPDGHPTDFWIMGNSGEKLIPARYGS